MAAMNCLLYGVAMVAVLPSMADVVIQSLPEPALRGSSTTAGSCTGGEWCDAVDAFAALFDSNDPQKMQRAVDGYSEWDSNEDGIKVSVTKSHYYAMYHENVQTVLARYVGQGYFAWSFDGPFKQPEELNDAAHPDQITLVRDGTLTMNLGWGMRNLFWSSVVKPLPDGQVFPYSNVGDFHDCDKCASKQVLTLKKGGLSASGDAWKIVGISIVKLA